jgi:hypothetical protein
VSSMKREASPLDSMLSGARAAQVTVLLVINVGAVDIMRASATVVNWAAPGRRAAARAQCGTISCKLVYAADLRCHQLTVTKLESLLFSFDLLLRELKPQCATVQVLGSPRSQTAAQRLINEDKARNVADSQVAAARFMVADADDAARDAASGAAPSGLAFAPVTEHVNKAEAPQRPAAVPADAPVGAAAGGDHHSSPMTLAPPAVPSDAAVARPGGTSPAAETQRQLDGGSPVKPRVPQADARPPQSPAKSRDTQSDQHAALKRTGAEPDRPVERPDSASTQRKPSTGGSEKEPTQMLEKLREYVETCGGTWVPGWSVEVRRCWQSVMSAFELWRDRCAAIWLGG